LATGGLRRISRSSSRADRVTGDATNGTRRGLFFS
jgi:hypothetical protein